MGKRRHYFALLMSLLSCPGRLAWQAVVPPHQRTRTGMVGEGLSCKYGRQNVAMDVALAMSDSGSAILDPEVCEQFKILACSSTSCSQKRNVFGMDEFATVGALWERKEVADAPGVQVEESPCLGRCKLAPCVAIQHEDYEGTVALEGMTQAEFNDRVFHKIVTEEDCDRVWESVENAIRIMADESDDIDDRSV